MKMLGRDTGELRMPLTPLTAKEESKLQDTLHKYGLI
jgi:4-hydroxy-tetrahydrodipicolinate synthase